LLTKKRWERTQKIANFKAKHKNVWERRSHAFPPHYAHGYDDVIFVDFGELGQPFNRASGARRSNTQSRGILIRDKFVYSATTQR